MARKTKTKTTTAAGEPVGEGHNLTPEQEERALLLHHFDKLRQQEAKAAEKKAEYDAEREALTHLFRIAKADGFKRKELQALLDDTRALRRDLTAEEERRARLRSYVGLPAGTQLELFSSPLEMQDEQHAQGQGYAAGLRGEPGTVPDHIEARFVQAYMGGWGRGQEELSWALSEAGRIVDRKKNAQARPVELEPEPQDEAPIDPEGQLAEDAERIQEAGWAQPRAEEQELPEAAA